MNKNEEDGSKVLIRKFNLYMVDCCGNGWSEKDYQEMINRYVLDRISTNGHCLLKEVKRVGMDDEVFEGHPLNTFDGSEDINVWEEVLNE